MDLITLALVGMVVMLVLLFLGMHIGLAMMIVGFFGYLLATGNLNASIGVLRLIPASTASSSSLCVIPLFILMGNAAFAAGMSEGLFNAGDKWLGKLPGGVGCATIAACAGFGAICGSAPATAATMGVVAIPKMRSLGYNDALATGIVASGGTLGILIPPSTPMIIYGIMSESSIGRLFAGGVIPGILLALLMMATIVIEVKLFPSHAPSTKRTITWKERFRSLKGLFWVVLLFLIVLGGMFTGFFSVNESAAIGALVAIIIMVISKRFTWKVFKDLMLLSLRQSCMVYLVIMGADVLSRFLAITGLPEVLAAFTAGLNVSRYVVILVIILIYAILGCFLDALPMITLTVPIFLPIIMGLGFDVIWFGIICVIVMELGFITPPVGMCSYVISGVVKDIPLKTVFSGAVRFIPAIIICAVILTLFPNIALWLPNLLFGT